MVDKEELINLVQNEPLLWNQKLPQYHSLRRQKKMAIWKRIGDILQLDAASTKKQWDILRGSYQRELKKIPKPKSGSTAISYVSKWQYFPAMHSFLSDNMAPQDRDTNLNLICVEEVDIDEDLTSIGAADNHVDVLIQQPSSSKASSNCSTTPPLIGSQKRKNADMLVDLEQKKLRLYEKRLEFKERTMDPDLLFFKSLLPDIKKLKMKIKFRMKVLQLLEQCTEDEQYDS